MKAESRRRTPVWPEGATQRWGQTFLRIGHGGASSHARANSMESLQAAIAMGVDVVEFDVRPCRDGLVLVHDEALPGPRALPVADCTLADLRAAFSADPVPTLAEALSFVKGRALLNLDLKAEGCEAAVLEQLRDQGMLPDTLISSLRPTSLLRIRNMEPPALTGLSYPEDRGGASANRRLKLVVDAVVATMRLSLPYRLPGMIDRAQSNAVMLYHKVVSRAAVRVVHALGGKVFVWTVDDPALLHRIHLMGVDGIATNDPLIFTAPDHSA